MCMPTAIYVHLLLVLVYSTYTVQAYMLCNTTYNSSGLSCYPCGPGFKKQRDCIYNNQQAQCEHCVSGEYQPSCNIALTCQKCSTQCRIKKMVKTKNCTETSDITCECKDEMFLFMDGMEDGFCEMHSMCGSGKGLLERGNNLEDTKCIDCVDGKTFSSKPSLEKCKNCTICSSYLTHCTNMSDAVCAIPVSGLSTGQLVALPVTVTSFIVAVAVIILACWKCRRPAAEERRKTDDDDTNKTCNEDVQKNGSSQVPLLVNNSNAVANKSSISLNKSNKDSDKTLLKCEPNNSLTNGNANDMKIAPHSQDKQSATYILDMDTCPLDDESVALSCAHYRSDDNQTVPGKDLKSDSTNQQYPVNFLAKNKPVSELGATITDQNLVHRSTFLSDNLSPDNFRCFYRNLIALTSKEIIPDVEIDVVREENENHKERCHQLLRKWLHSRGNPACDNDICTALLQCKFKLVSQKYSSSVFKQ